MAAARPPRPGALLPAVLEPHSVRSVAVLADIHGNLPALEAVLAKLRVLAPDLVVVAGDALAGPFPVETLAALEALGSRVRFVCGNADRAAVEAFDAVADAARDAMDAYAGACLDRAARDRVALWPAALALRVEGIGSVRVCHATPRSDTEILTDRTPLAQAAACLEGVPEETVVVGHTHMAYDRRVGPRRLVNAGSVGMPYGGPGADWLWLGPVATAMHTDYDLGAAAQRIAASTWPEAAAFARDNVVRTPSRAEATAFFERLAGRAR